MAEKSLHSLSVEKLQELRDKYMISEIAEQFGITHRKAEYFFLSRGIKKDKGGVKEMRSEILLKSRKEWLKSNADKKAAEAKKVEPKKIQGKPGVICNVKVKVHKTKNSDHRNVMNRETYDPNKQGLTWSWKR